METFRAYIVSVLIAGVFVSGEGLGAGVRGRVQITPPATTGHGADNSRQQVSVALLPADGRRVRVGPGQTHRIDLAANRMQPDFLTVTRASRVKFVNRDKVFHQLFSLSTAEPVSLQLAKSGSSESSSVVILKETGTHHFFCRIHNKSYARIDVIDTPYLQQVETGAEFQFKGVRPGKWQLRLAAPGAQTLVVPVIAVTGPKTLQLKLASTAGGKSDSLLELPGETARLFAH